MKGRAVLCWICRLGLTGLFGYSGWIKLLDPETFARSVAGYDVLPLSLIPLVTFWIPWLELWCAVTLLTIPLGRKPASLLILLMLTGFTLLKISAVIRGLDISCGCTGSDDPLGWWSVVQNLIWMAVTGLHLRIEQRA